MDAGKEKSRIRWEVSPVKKVLAVMMTLFCILTFVGAGYVLYTRGEASPGYAVIPMLFCLICSSSLQKLKKKEQNEKE